MGDIVSGGITYLGMNQAGKSMKSGANNQIALEREMFNYSKGLQKPFYDLGLPAFKSYASAITGTIDPNTGKTWTPETSPAYQWQKQQGEQNLSRSLRALGRSNSTYGMNATGDFNRNLAGAEYQNQLARLADLSNIAQGGASDLSSLATGYGQRQGQNILNRAENEAQLQLAKYATLGKMGGSLTNKMATGAAAPGGFSMGSLFNPTR